MTAEVECRCGECGAEFTVKPEGGHRLLCGDSTVATDVERVLAGVAPHLMVTDPPYGVNYDPAWRNRAAAEGTIGQKKASRAIGEVVNDDRADWRDAWVLFPGSVAYAPLVTLMVIISMIFNLSGTMGPTVGGFLTDTLSWHWIFLVNIVPGLLVAGVVWVTIDIDKPDLSLLRGFDLSGLVLMAIFLGCLQYALEEGPRWDWLDERTIRVAVIVSAVAGSLFFWRVLSYRQPIVDLRTFGDRNFALGSFFTFMMGIGMYGTTYLVPLFLAQARGFSALQIGETVVVVGLTQLVISPITPRIARRLDLRITLSIGVALFAVSMYLTG